MTTDFLARYLAETFPIDAVSWAQATDEVRDMCKAARVLSGVPDSFALDFNSLSTPSQWNTFGTAFILKFYAGLTAEQRKEFCTMFSFLPV